MYSENDIQELNDLIAAPAASGESLEPSPAGGGDETETNEQIARRKAKQYGVDPDLAVSLMAQESRKKTKATSWKGAGGPMQLMPETAKSLGVTDLYDPEQNIDAGVRYLKQGLDKFGNTEEGKKKAIAGYNLGFDSKILKAKDWWSRLQYASNDPDVQAGRRPRGVSDKTNTQNYVKNIWSNYVKGGGGGTAMPYKITEEDIKELNGLITAPNPAAVTDKDVEDLNNLITGAEPKPAEPGQLLKPGEPLSQQQAPVIGANAEPAATSPVVAGPPPAAAASTAAPAKPSNVKPLTDPTKISKPSAVQPKFEGQVINFPIDRKEFEKANEYQRSIGQPELTEDQFRANTARAGSTTASIDPSKFNVKDYDSSPGSVLDVPVTSLELGETTAGGGQIVTPPETIGTYHPGQDHVVAKYQTNPNQSEEEAYRDALSSVASKIGAPIDIDSAVRKHRAAGRPLFAGGYQPGGSVTITENDLKDLGVDPNVFMANQAIRRADARDTVAGNVPKPATGFDARKALIDDINSAGPVSASLAGPAALMDGRVGDAARTAGTLPSAAIGETIGWVGSIDGAVAGLTNLVTGAGTGPDSDYRSNIGLGLNRFVRNIADFQEGTSEVNEKTGQTYVDTDEQGNQVLKPTTPTMVVRMVAATPKFALMSMLPGGIVGGMALESGGLERLRQLRLVNQGKGKFDNAALATQFAKGLGNGALLHYLPKGMNKLFFGQQAVPATMIDSASAATVPFRTEAIKAGTEIFSIGAGNFLVNKAFGDPDKDNLVNSVALALFHGYGMGKGILKGKTVVAADTHGNTVWFKVEDNKAVTVPPQKADIELYKVADTQAAPSPDEDVARVEAEAKAATNGGNEPPQRPGTIRFYHGGADYSEHPGMGRWVTEDREYAEGYARKSGGSVQYVDIPEDSPFLKNLNKVYDDSGTPMRAPYVSWEAPEEIAKDLKPLAATNGGIFEPPVEPKSEFQQKSREEKEQIIRQSGEFTATHIDPQGRPVQVTDRPGPAVLVDWEDGAVTMIPRGEFEQHFKPVGSQPPPVPETPDALAAQTKAAEDPSQTARIAVMYAGTQAGDAPAKGTAKAYRVVMPNGDVVMVDKAGWAAKSKELGYDERKDGLVQFLYEHKEKGIQELLGRVDTVQDTSQGTAITATSSPAEGSKQVDAAVVTSPESAEAQKQSYEEQYPGATVEEKSVDEAVAQRIGDHANENSASRTEPVKITQLRIGDQYLDPVSKEVYTVETLPNAQRQYTFRVRDAKGESVVVAPGSDAVRDRIVQPTPNDLGAHQAATSPLNDKAEPTQEQKESGNYDKGKIIVGGHEIAVENPAGSVRSGTDAEGEPWSVTLRDHYGYVERTKGADKEEVDVFVNPGTPQDHNGPVYVVNQIDPKTGDFDEHKVMIGYKSMADAQEGYRRNYADDWAGMGSVVRMTPEQFDLWLKGKPTEEAGRDSHTDFVPTEGLSGKNIKKGDKLYYKGQPVVVSNVGKSWIMLSDIEGNHSFSTNRLGIDHILFDNKYPNRPKNSDVARVGSTFTTADGRKGTIVKIDGSNYTTRIEGYKEGTIKKNPLNKQPWKFDDETPIAPPKKAKTSYKVGDKFTDSEGRSAEIIDTDMQGGKRKTKVYVLRVEGEDKPIVRTKPFVDKLTRVEDTAPAPSGEVPSPSQPQQETAEAPGRKEIGNPAPSSSESLKAGDTITFTRDGEILHGVIDRVNSAHGGYDVRELNRRGELSGMGMFVKNEDVVQPSSATPEQIDKRTPYAKKADEFREKTGREPTESEAFQMTHGDAPDVVIQRSKATGKGVGQHVQGDTVLWTDDSGKTHTGTFVRGSDSSGTASVIPDKVNGTPMKNAREVSYGRLRRVESGGATVPQDVASKLKPFEERSTAKDFPSVREVAQATLPRDVYEQWEPLLDLAERNGIYVDVSKGSMPPGMMASWQYGMINIDPNVIKSFANSPEEFARTVGHETVHGLLSIGLQRDGEYQFHREMLPVFDKLMERYEQAPPRVQAILDYIKEDSAANKKYDYEGSTPEQLESGKVPHTGDFEELVTYAFTEPEFAKFLDGIEYRAPSGERTTIFNYLKDLVRRVIGSTSKDGTALDAVNKSLNKYFDTSWNEKDRQMLRQPTVEVADPAAPQPPESKLPQPPEPVARTVGVGETVYAPNGSQGEVLHSDKDTVTVQFFDAEGVEKGQPIEYKGEEIAKLSKTDPNGEAGFVSVRALGGGIALRLLGWLDNARAVMGVMPIRKLTEAGLMVPAYRHAASRHRLPFEVRKMLSEVFEDDYGSSAAMERTISILNKDNILAGHQYFREQERIARAAGDTAAATKWDAKAQAVEAAHPVLDYRREVIAATHDPVITAHIARWRQVVNEPLDEMFHKMKGLNPGELPTGRGLIFGARVNLLPKNREADMLDWVKQEKSQPSPSASNYRNPNAKKDPYDRRADFTGEYSTDPTLVLTNALGPRLVESTKIDLIHAVEDSGNGVLERMGDHDFVRPEGMVRMPVTLPETNADGFTRQVQHNLWVHPELVRELRTVLNTDQSTPQIPGLGALTQMQLFQFVDGVAHIKNVHTVIAHAASTSSAFKNAIRATPLLGTADGAARIAKQVQLAFFKDPTSPEGRQVLQDLGYLASLNLIRPEHLTSGKMLEFGHLTGMHTLVKWVDTGSRLVLYNFFKEMVKGKPHLDTEDNLIKFVRSIGEYNTRVMTPLMAVAKQSGMSPFIVAGRTFNSFGRRLFTGAQPSGGVLDGMSAAENIAQRMANIAAVWAAPIALNAMLNLSTTGMIGGRPGTPLGAWDLGYPEDEHGKFTTLDMLQLGGQRRAMRTLGLNSVYEGVEAGDTLTNIAGNAFLEASTTALHPWIGPAPGFIYQGLTGSRIDLRGGPVPVEARNMGDKGWQYLENLRVAAKNQNPFLYGIVSALGLDTAETKADSTPWTRLMEGIAKGPLSSVGYSSAQSPANKLASEIFRMKGSFTKTPTADAQRAVLSGFKTRMIAGDPTVDQDIQKAILNNEITFAQARNLESNKGLDPLAVSLKYLDVVPDGIRVWRVMTDDQRRKYFPILLAKYAAGLQRGDVSPEDADLFSKYLDPDSVQKLYQVGQSKIQQKIAIDQAITNKQNGMPWQSGLDKNEKKQVIKKAALNDVQEDFAGKPDPQKVFLFENQPIEYKAQVAPQLRELKEKLDKKKDKNADDWSTINSINKALNKYREERATAPPDKQAELVRAETEATQNLRRSVPPSVPKSPSFGKPSFMRP